MKRHASLIPLSHEHHEALILARLIQLGSPPYKGLPTEPVEKALFANKFYEEKLAEHFKQEEAIIPIVKDLSVELDNLLEEMAREHRSLRILFDSLASQTELTEILDHLGKTLEIHIRKEERQIFPLIQDKCNDEILEEIRLLLAVH